MIDAGSAGHPRARLVPSPKPGGTRWLAVLDPRTASTYAAAVAVVAPAIESSLRDGVVANRVAFVRGSRIQLQPWRPARARFLAEGRRLAASCGAMLVADVRECYASIRPDVVNARLRAIGCGMGEVRTIDRSLAGLGAAGIPGLPVGPMASAVLANAVLAAGDDALADAAMAHLRWVDDFVVFTDDVVGAHVALERLRRALGALGLSLAENKTSVLEGPRAIDSALSSGPVSGVAARYHRRADAHPVPGLEGPHAVPSADGGVDPCRRKARATGGNR
jgi:hypothetical protein